MIGLNDSSIDHKTKLSFVGLEIPMTPRRELSRFCFVAFSFVFIVCLPSAAVAAAAEQLIGFANPLVPVLFVLIAPFDACIY